jgi:uncharacterized damage-inducible protein DinB
LLTGKERMKKEQLFNHLLGKSSCSVAELRQLKESYPYFSMARILFLKALKDESEESFHKEIKSNALFISHRKQLFHLLNDYETRDISNFIYTETEKKISEDSQKNDLLDFSASFTLNTDSIISSKENIISEDNDESMDKTEEKEENLPSFTDWLDAVETKNEGKNKFSLIDQFVNEEVGAIRADKKTNLQGDVSKKSVQEDESFITDTLAKIYIKQGLYSKAIYAYEKLSLKYPEKSIYFATQIEEIKKITNK